jgi:hypothetical protein
LIERLGAAELLVELKKYCEIMIYSYLPEAFIKEVLLILSIVQGDPEDKYLYRIKDEIFIN